MGLHLGAHGRDCRQRVGNNDACGFAPSALDQHGSAHTQMLVSIRRGRSSWCYWSTWWWFSVWLCGGRCGLHGRWSLWTAILVVMGCRLGSSCGGWYWLWSCSWRRREFLRNQVFPAPGCCEPHCYVKQVAETKTRLSPPAFENLLVRNNVEFCA